MKLKKSMGASGQALIEYLLLFSFMTFIAIGLVKGLGNTMTSSVGNIGYELTEQLTVGVCKKLCFYDGFKNEEK
jgi:Flp pilus assembly pilin Flp